MHGNFFGQVARALFNQQVPLSNKLLFLVSVLGYTLVPLDVLPLLPFDDLLFAWLASVLFLRSANKHMASASEYDNGKVIDVEGDIVE